MNFGDRLKELRKGQKLTQRQLGERLGVAKSVVSYYESGDRFPSYDVLIKIAHTFHTTTDYLLGVERGRTLETTGLTEEEISAVSCLIELLRKNRV